MEEKERKSRRRKKENRSFYIKAVIILAVIICLRFFVIGTVYVKGSSMEPNYHHGDVVLINRLACTFGTLEHEDVVVCRITQGNQSEQIIKRIIGLPGDVIELKYDDRGDCRIWRNGELLEEEYILEEMEQMGGLEYPYTVEEDHYFVLGDNRNVSSDSRESSIGTIAKRDLMGKVVLRLYPLDSFGTVR